MVALWTPSGVALIAASNSPQAIASSRLPKAVGIREGRGEVAGAVGVGVDGGDELAAGHRREALGVGAGHGAGADDAGGVLLGAHR